MQCIYITLFLPGIVRIENRNNSSYFLASTQFVLCHNSILRLFSYFSIFKQLKKFSKYEFSDMSNGFGEGVGGCLDFHTSEM